MKRILLIAIALTIVSACKKEEQARPATPAPAANNSVNFAALKDVTWHHLAHIYANLRFASDGTYYENTTDDGDWSQVGTDSVYVTRPANSFYYRITSVTADTLKIVNPVFGNVTYYR